MNTVKKTDKSIEVEQLKKRFHILARSPPKFNIFTGAGREDFFEWSESCRNLENALREVGEVL